MKYIYLTLIVFFFWAGTTNAQTVDSRAISYRTNASDISCGGPFSSTCQSFFSQIKTGDQVQITATNPDFSALNGIYTVTNSNEFNNLIVTPQPPLTVFWNTYSVGNITLSKYTATVSQNIWGTGSVFGSTTPTELSYSMLAGVVSTGANIWPLFALLGISIAFVIAGLLIDFFQKSIKSTKIKEDISQLKKDNISEQINAKSNLERNQINKKFKKLIEDKEKTL